MSTTPRRPPAYPNEVAEIEDRIRHLFTLVETAERYPTDHPYSDGRFDAADLQSRTDAELSAHEVVRCPMGFLSRYGIHLLGCRLHELGGIDLMHEVLERLEDAEGNTRVGVVLDHAFDGIGSWVA